MTNVTPDCSAGDLLASESAITSNQKPSRRRSHVSDIQFPRFPDFSSSQIQRQELEAVWEATDMSAKSSFSDSRVAVEVKFNTCYVMASLPKRMEFAKQSKKEMWNKTGSVYCFQIHPPHVPAWAAFQPPQHEYEIQCLDYSEDQKRAKEDSVKCEACPLCSASPDSPAGYLWRASMEEDACSKVEGQGWFLQITNDCQSRSEGWPLGRGWSSRSRARRRWVSYKVEKSSQIFLTKIF